MENFNNQGTTMRANLSIKPQVLKERTITSLKIGALAFVLGVAGCADSTHEQALQAAEQKLADVSLLPAKPTIMPMPAVSAPVMPDLGAKNPFASGLVRPAPSETLPSSPNGTPPTTTSVLPAPPPPLGKPVPPPAPRTLEPLERYELASLRYRGILSERGALTAIVAAPDGTAHPVKVGQYLGRNHGRVQHIDGEKITLSKLVQAPDGQYYQVAAYLGFSP
ncbi:pilus assembly protein PilP [Moraxella caviae]|nr:pilus assembly protein PilP [Moraxella caviae]